MEHNHGMPPESVEVVVDKMESIPSKVERVIVEGVKRTRPCIIQSKVKQALKAKNFEEMLFLCSKAKKELESLGVFKNVTIYLDTCKDASASNHSYEVIFDVKEKRMVSCGITTQAGNNEATVESHVDMRNMQGRAENLRVMYARNFKENKDYRLRYFLPINGDPNLGFSTSVFQENVDVLRSGFKESNTGLITQLNFPTPFGESSISWHGIWRDLRAASKLTPFQVREQSGHSLKSSIQHTITNDGRDDKIFPTSGTYIKFLEEYAGLGGNVNFVKGELQIQTNKTILPNCVLQMSLSGGALWSLHKRQSVLIMDKFFIGGPLTLRGFDYRGVGPHVDGNSLGADAYWQAAAHLYTPLPFLNSSHGGFWKLFRSHFFVNAGNVGSVDLDKSVRENAASLLEKFRLSCGLGMVLRFGNIARMELNYVLPVRTQESDCVSPGLQFGVGVSFM